jgi:hypothetical protein
MRDNIETSQCNARAQQKAEEEQRRRPFRRNAFANGPPKAAEEDRPEQNAREQRKYQSKDES